MRTPIQHLKLIRGAEVYNPQPLGKKDVLIAADKIAVISDKIKLGLDVETIDGSGKILAPGFIDNHVHLLGGGGEGGFQNRTPEIMLTDITTAGVTTVIGCIGTDGLTRHMSSLIAKAKGLEEEGLTTYCYTGNYHLPLRTLTDSVQRDIVLIDKIIGVGEIALSDHRSSQPTLAELTRLAADARVGGILANKAGVVMLHMGGGKSQLKLIEQIVETTEIPISQFLPTHIGRDPRLFASAINFAKNGGNIDLTTSTPKQIENDKLTTASAAFKKLLAEGVPLKRISFSSDGQGSLPKFNGKGEFIGLKVGSVRTLYQAVRDAVLKEKIALEQALQVVTCNPARFFQLHNKGFIEVGKDADLVLLDKKELTINTVVARGQVMILHGRILKKGIFE